MGVLTPKLVSVFEDLLTLDLVRGFDSTGIGFVNQKYQLTTLKHTCWPYELMRAPSYAKLMGHHNVCLIGHNRAATKGSVTKENAHPFMHDGIVLAHNGTLDQPGKLPDYSHKDSKTDSEAICKAVSKLGIKEAWKLVCGAATLVFWDRKTNSLNFVSNNQRPFHFCYVNNKTAVVWASDENMLKAALNRRDVDIDNKEIISPHRDRLYTITIPEKKGALLVEKTDLDPFSFHVARRGYHHGDSEYWPQQDELWQDRAKRARVATAAESFRGGHGTVTTPPFNLNKNDAMSEEDFNKAIEDCLFCERSVKGQFKECTIIDTRSAACKKCSDVAAREHIRLN